MVGVGVGVGACVILVESFNFLLFGLLIAVVVNVFVLVDALPFTGGTINEFILLLIAADERLVLKALLFKRLLLKSRPVLSLFTDSSILNNFSLSSGELLFKIYDGSP